MRPDGWGLPIEAAPRENRRIERLDAPAPDRVELLAKHTGREECKDGMNFAGGAARRSDGARQLRAA